MDNVIESLVFIKKSAAGVGLYGKRGPSSFAMEIDVEPLAFAAKSCADMHFFMETNGSATSSFKK